MKKLSLCSLLSLSLLLLIMSNTKVTRATAGLGSWCLAQGQMWEGSHKRCIIGPGGVATVSEPLTIDKEASIDIYENGRLINESQIIIDGSVYSDGRIDNRGEIDSEGTILNDGVFVSDGSVNHNGSFLNRSVLNIYERMDGEFIANGILINQGSMVLSGTLKVNASGTLSNWGVISNTGAIDVGETTIRNYNFIQNEGMIQFEFTRFLNHGTVANAGTINNDNSTIYNLCQGVISGIQPVGGVVVLLEDCAYLPQVSDG